ncbi:MAG: hypothetical protein WBA07_33655 [Rivularia sp. (in: cyanobacteria)]
MPRRRSRFKRLDADYRATRGNIPAENVELTNYIEWRKGNRKITVSKTLTDAERKRFGFKILPFNVEIGATPLTTEYYAAPITAYSNAGRITLGLSNTELGYAVIDGNTVQNDNFYPALLRVFKKDSATSTAATKTSDITGNSYKRHAGNSYSIPFGRSLDSDKDGSLASSGENDTKNALITLLKAQATVGSISYDPEVFRSGRILSSPTS